MAELLDRFLNAEEAKKLIDDIRDVEQVLHDHPAPQPSARLLADIKKNLSSGLSTRRVRLDRHKTYTRIAAVAAIVMITGLIASRFKIGPDPIGLASASLLPTAIWESGNIAVDDEKLAIFTAEIEQIENEVMILELDDDTSDSGNTLEELEIELIVARNDFWKE